jgi:tetratricopeptide (TPR) repeat protein
MVPVADAAATHFICCSARGRLGSFAGETSFSEIIDMELSTFPSLSCRSRKYENVRPDNVPSYACIGSLILLVTLALSTVSIAETYEFNVLYAEVPGIDMALAGNPDAAILILERRARDVDNQYAADERATLCALYVVRRRFVDAADKCDAAVDNDHSDMAYNNRGVLRARLGNTPGALEDFDCARVLPEDQSRYIGQLKSANARFMASRNFAMANAYIARHAINRLTMVGAVTGARIEDLEN